MKRLVKILSVALCVMIVMLTAVSTAFAFSLSSFGIGSDSTEKATPDEAKVFKEESVYVLALADGTVDKIIVSDWIQNKDHRPALEDVATLKDIENVKGDETYTLNEQNMRVWNTGGKDLYLEGEGEEELPVGLSVSYTLDGKTISPEDIKGKSGRVSIRFDYENRQYEYVEIDGKKEKMYVPFVMLTGLLLDNEKFSDIEVTNGKLISDGDRAIVAGIAFPGLSENLSLSTKDVSIPDYVTVSADVEDFEMGSTITIATNDLFNKIDTSDLDSIDDINEAMSQLDSAMAALIDGSSALYEGLSTLLEKSGELTDGISALAQGAQALADGADQLDEGAIQIDAGMLSLKNGLSALTLNNAALTGGSEQTFDAILKTATSTLREQGLSIPDLTRENYRTVLEGLTEQLSDENVEALAKAQAKEKVSAAVEAERETVEAAVTAAVRENVKDQVTSAVEAQVRAAVLETMGYSEEDYQTALDSGLVDEATQSAVEAAIKAQTASDETQAIIESKTEEQMQSETVLSLISTNTDAKIASLIEEQMQSDTVKSAIENALKNAKDARGQISALIEQLDAYGSFDQGLKTYTGGVREASAGASQLSQGTEALSKGTKELSTGSKELLSGVLTLRDGVPALVTGVSQLTDGSMQLTQGLQTFSDEGISKITSLFSGDLSRLGTRLKAMVDVSKDYKSYSGLAPDMDGEVKFIYKTEAID